MKKIIFYALLIVAVQILFVSHSKADGNIVLPREWKFQTGDSSAYSNPDFSDKDWKTIKVETYWETQGYTDYNGIAWYRTRVVIPSSLKEKNKLLKALRISLGRIDDGDDTYFNGQRIGGYIAWDSYRNYVIPFDLIRWDQENIIAIRVNDIAGNGGMYGGPGTIGNMQLANVVDLSTTGTPSLFATENTMFHKNLHFKFNLPLDSISGILSVKVYEPKSMNVVFHKDSKLTIGSKADTIFNLSVEIKQPNMYRVEYIFVAIGLPDTLKYSTLFSYVQSPRTNLQFVETIEKQIIAGETNSFGIENITFEGYLNDRLNANLTERLLKIDEKGILECYYNRPGNQTWIGEYAGKYLHAASRVWRSTHNVKLKAQMDRIVDILIGCQNEDGYLGTYLPVNYWTDWDVWAHKYNMLGLLSYYAATGYKPALETSIKMGDLLCKTFGEKEGQLNIINSSGHIGMASTSVLEPMTYLYQYTGDKRYLDFCNYIIKAYDYDQGPKIISTLTTLGKVDKTANAKAYEMMSNLTGIVKLYQLTGNAKLLKAAENAWNDISTNKLYITGTASKGEHFPDDFDLPAGNDVNMGEGCVTATWLQFSQAMYYLTGEAKYIDEIEKSIYNHLLAAENPETGCVSYYTALQGKKPYRCTIFGHCCLASIPRGIAAIPELAYAKNVDNGFSINLYSSGRLKDKIMTKNGKEIAVDCKVESNFPQEGKAKITITPSAKASFKLMLRVPAWCKSFKANYGGKNYAGIAGQYLVIEKDWVGATTILVSFDLNTQLLDGGKSYAGFEAVKVGPQVLAIDQALNPGLKDLDKITMGSLNLTPISKSLLPKSWVGSQIYSTKAFYGGKPIELKLVPFADAGQTDGEVRVWIRKK